MPEERAEPGVEIQGLGVSLSAKAVAALLAPEARATARIDVNLANLSIRVSGETVREVVARFVPTAGEVSLTSGGLEVSLSDQPGVRLNLPIGGLCVRIEGDAVRVEPGG
jgi:hypothetical protein